MIPKYVKVLFHDYISKNDFLVVSSVNEDKITEYRFTVSEPILTLNEMRKNFSFALDNYLTMANHPGVETAMELAKLLGIPYVRSFVPYFGNEEPDIDLEESLGDDTVILIAPRCRSICDDPLIEKRFYSPSDNYQQMRAILEAITSHGERGITRSILAMTYFSCGKKERMEAHSYLPMMQIGRDLEAYDHICNILTAFMHSEGTVNCFRNCRVDNTKIAPPFTRVIERFCIDDGLDISCVCIYAPDDSAVKKIGPTAGAVNLSLSYNFKTRPTPTTVESRGAVINVKDMHVIMGDDLTQSFATMHEGIIKCCQNGARDITLILGAADFTFNKDHHKYAHELMLDNEFIRKIIIFDTTPLYKLLVDEAIKRGLQHKIVVVKFSTLLAYYIWRKALKLSSRDFREEKPKNSLIDRR